MESNCKQTRRIRKLLCLFLTAYGKTRVRNGIFIGLTARLPPRRGLNGIAAVTSRVGMRIARLRDASRKGRLFFSRIWRELPRKASGLGFHVKREDLELQEVALRLRPLNLRAIAYGRNVFPSLR